MVVVVVVVGVQPLGHCLLVYQLLSAVSKGHAAGGDGLCCFCILFRTNLFGPLFGTPNMPLKPAPYATAFWQNQTFPLVLYLGVSVPCLTYPFAPTFCYNLSLPPPPVFWHTWYQVFGTRCLVPSTKWLVPGDRYPVPGTRYQVPGTWCSDRSEINIVQNVRNVETCSERSEHRSEAT